MAVPLLFVLLKHLNLHRDKEKRFAMHIPTQKKE